MKQKQMIPLYATDGRSLGFRTLKEAEEQLADGYVKASYGRNKDMKAIWLQQNNGGNPIGTRPPIGTRYSHQESLDSGHHCWKFRRLDGRDDDGVNVNTRGVFM